MARVSVQQRRQDLVEAAFQVMARDGVAQTTTRAICAEAGVHQSVFHYSFGSKKELLEELVQITIGSMIDAAIDAKKVTTDVGESFRNGIRSAWDKAKAHPERQLVGYELTTYVLREPDLAALAEWQYAQYYAQTERSIATMEEIAGVGWVVPRSVLARMLTSAIDGLVLGWLADRDTAAAEASLDAFADYFTSLATPRDR
ncbi:TetR family transcriptional regulator [Williamsia limnetica]|jgi:AcrR family transcriptional regulator|uniref:TetR/AcrR family transcriptional regulator n=2 Tax=Mycobacteriales TaxID=85007 RepID=A0ABT4MWR9_GORRU|nr:MULTISPECIES: TetR/AcrR family transcriptional regulator [Mycobacteriales]MCZ4551464.1 TetR/AcrR family transcriptional regulator [Gordonia rubripertincta]PYE12764.1 TetR family transcriptional regulator [Williamsia limnetica]